MALLIGQNLRTYWNIKDKFPTNKIPLYHRRQREWWSAKEQIQKWNYLWTMMTWPSGDKIKERKKLLIPPEQVIMCSKQKLILLPNLSVRKKWICAILFVSFGWKCHFLSGRPCDNENGGDCDRMYIPRRCSFKQQFRAVCVDVSEWALIDYLSAKTCPFFAFSLVQNLVSLFPSSPVCALK